MTTPTETPPTTDPIRDALRAMQSFLQGDDDPAVADLCALVNRAAEEHARRTEPQGGANTNASPEERVLTPGERAAFLAGVSAADEDREFEERYTSATTTDEPPQADPRYMPVGESHATVGEKLRKVAPDLKPPTDPTDDPPLTEADLRAAEERWHAFRVAIETITTEEGEDPAEELFESARDLVHGDIAEEHEDMIDSHRARVNALRGAFLDARTDLPRALREIRRQRATVDAAAKHLGCEPHVLVLCASSRMAEIERLTAILREARRRLAPLPRALTPEDHEPDTLPARIDAVLGGKDH